ncbi:amidase family protein [Actinokineospora sp. HUAS TT18]|uniref:amidase family protein n=1 Tax=Actinokineospora sp. HUAS TT18 TaxID=3447451 RepID=UPI003F51FB9C
MTAAAATSYLDQTLGGPGHTRLPLLLGGVVDRDAAVAAAGLSRDEWRDVRRRWATDADRVTRAMTWVDRDVDHAAVTISVKDTVDVAGMPTGLGHLTHRHYPSTSAEVVRWVQRLGLAVVGKAYATELNIGPPEIAVNPAFPELSPGGSSTGSAVSVAAGISDLALSTDVLGSTRWPATNCGVAGLRTTWDPTRLAGVLPVSPSQDALGFMARTVADLGWLWRRLRPSVPDGRPPVVATVANAWTCVPVIADAVRHAAEAVRELGFVVTEIELPERLWAVRELAWELCAADVAEVVAEVESRMDLSISATARASLRPPVSVTRRAELMAARNAFAVELPALLDEAGIDVLLLPVSPAPPKRVVERAGKPTLPKPGDADYADRVGYTPVASFAGLPALVQPVRVSEEFGPLGMQLVGRRDAEATLLDIGARLERALGTHREVADLVARSLAGRTVAGKP